MTQLKSIFDNSGVIDCGVRCSEGDKSFRVVILKHGSVYSVQKHFFYPQNGEMEVEYSGSLKSCILHAKQNYKTEISLANRR